MSELITRLKTKHNDKLEAATTHAFTNDLCAGTLSDSRLFTYLVQDQLFFMTSLRMIARTASLCRDDRSLIVLGKQIGFLASCENSYFDAVLGDLSAQLKKVPSDLPVLPEVSDFLDLLDELANSDSYCQNIVALYAFELVYLLWAEPHEHTVDHLSYKHKEWVYLHCGSKFTEWVKFLENEVIRVLDDSTLEEADAMMSRVLELERKFFDATYNYTE